MFVLPFILLICCCYFATCSTCILVHLTIHLIYSLSLLILLRERCVCTRNLNIMCLYSLSIVSFILFVCCCFFNGFVEIELEGSCKYWCLMLNNKFVSSTVRSIKSMCVFDFITILLLLLSSWKKSVIFWLMKKFIRLFRWWKSFFFIQ